MCTWLEVSEFVNVTIGCGTGFGSPPFHKNLALENVLGIAFSSRLEQFKFIYNTHRHNIKDIPDLYKKKLSNRIIPMM